MRGATAELLDEYENAAKHRPVDASCLVRILQDQKVSQDCEGAAANYFMLIAPLIYHRPELAESLLVFPLRPLYYLGFERNQVSKWAASKLPEYAGASRIPHEYLTNLCQLLAVSETLLERLFAQMASEEQDSN